MPVPFQIVQASSTAPFVLTCEHASARIPTGVIADSKARAVLRTHWGHDLGAWKFTRALASRLGASAIGGRWSRLWIDLNRRVDDPSLVRASADGVPLPWNQRLTPAAIEQRIVTFHSPYHVQVDRMILRRLVRRVRPIVFAIHSFTPVYEGRPRRFDVGLLYEHHAGAARRLARTIRDAGYSVRFNQPYSGMDGMMYAVDRHGSHHRLPCLEIEINDALLENDARATKLLEAVARGLESLTSSPR